MLHYETHLLSAEHEWVVFLHGLGGNSNIWYRQVKEFKKHFNLLFIDLRDHGGSANYEPDILTYTPEILSKDVVQVLDELAIDKAHFAGISLGSVVLHALHIHAPSRIKSMILGGAIIRLTHVAKAILRTGNLLKNVVPYMWLYKTFAFILMPKAHHKKSRDVFIQEAKKLQQQGFIKWYRFAAKVCKIYPQIDTEKNIIPKLYIMGDQDYMFLGPVKEDTVGDKAANLHIIEACGHVCNIEKYKEFNQTAIQFFKDQEVVSRAVLIQKSTFAKLNKMKTSLSL